MKPQWGRGVLVSGLVLSVIACPPGTQQSLSSPPWRERPECPVDSTVAWVWNAKQETWGAIAEIPLSGPISTIPEFHDCQRFIVEGDTYGPLYAIYASYRLSVLAQQADSLIRGTSTSYAVPAATIFNYGASYAPLGIEPGFSCLYLWNPMSWRAKLVSFGFSEPDCLKPIDPGQVEGMELEVWPVEVDPFGEGDYPPVARWDWDSTKGRQYIGIKCGKAWCEIGGPGTKRIPAYRAPPELAFDGVSSSDPAVDRVSHIKGWNDVQRLDSVAYGKQVPTGIWGTIIPHPRNDRIDNVSAFQNTWLNVANAIIQGGNYTKRGFTEGVNRIFFCHGTAVSSDATEPGCKGASGVSCSPDKTDGIAWYAMIVSAASDTAYKCVIRRVHTGANVPGIPGAARWRWVVDDVTNWIKCPTGCCEIR